MTRMVRGSALYYRDGAFPDSHLYDVLEGRDVLLPALSDFRAQAVKATRKRPAHIRLTVDVVLPADVSPTVEDVAWTLPEGALTDCVLVLGYKPNVLNLSPPD